MDSKKYTIDENVNLYNDEVAEIVFTPWHELSEEVKKHNEILHAIFESKNATKH